MGTLYDGFIQSLDSSSIDKRKHLAFILRTLGFEDELIRTNFIESLYKHNELELVYKIMKGEMSFKKSFADYNEFGIITLQNAPILSYLKDTTSIPNNYISATDISSYVYCPASYSIKQTFNEIAQYNEEAEIGTSMHEHNRLAAYLPKEKGGKLFKDFIAGDPEFYTEHNKSFFDDIRNSSIYYIGHAENSVKYFKSSKGKFVGQPDYVFKNDLGENFVVEEKFRNFKSKATVAYNNHKAQIISYLSGLDTINAKYGYLVYWYYEYSKKYRRVKECIVYKYENDSNNASYIREVYTKILELNKGYVLPFGTRKLDANKCTNCAMRIFCGHKTGRLSEIAVPYKKEYYELIK